MFSKKGYDMEFKKWEDMSELEQLQLTHWDMYKDAYGVRPRHIDTSKWSKADFEKHFEVLVEVMEENERAEQESQASASHDFELRIQTLLTCGASDREMALRWIHEAEESNGDEEYLCYLVGLPYGYFRVAETA